MKQGLASAAVTFRVLLPRRRCVRGVSCFLYLPADVARRMQLAVVAVVLLCSGTFFDSFAICSGCSNCAGVVLRCIAAGVSSVSVELSFKSYFLERVCL